MKNNNMFYNMSSFKFFHRQIKPLDIDKAFIKLIETEEQKQKEKKDNSSKEEISTINKKTINKANTQNNSPVYPKELNRIYNSTQYDDKITKNICLDLLFQKNSLEKIKKIRDLFIEFDTDKSRTLDQNELYLMFNLNKIPIKYDEIKELFGFSHKMKFISFYDFIKLTVNEEFSRKFRNFIMNKVKDRIKDGDVCPNDFNEMLTHLCEFGKISDKAKKDGNIKYVKNHGPHIPKYLLNSENFRKRYHINKSIDLSQNNNIIKRNSFLSEEKTSKQIKDNILTEPNNENNLILNLNENSEKNINTNIIDNNKDNKNEKKFLSLFEKEKEVKSIIELSNKKLFRIKQNCKKIILKDKIFQDKQKLSKSIDIINNINSDIANNFISFYPTENIFKNVKNNKILSFSFNNNKEHIPILRNNYNTKNNLLKEEQKKYTRNKFFDKQYKHNRFKLFKTGKYFQTTNPLNLSYKFIEEQENNHLLPEFNLKLFPIINPQNKSKKIKYNSFNNKKDLESTIFPTTQNSNLEY